MNQRPTLVNQYLERALRDAGSTPRQVVLTLTGKVDVPNEPGLPLRFRVDAWCELDTVEFGREGYDQAKEVVRTSLVYRDGKVTFRKLDSAESPLQVPTFPSSYLAQLPLVPHAMLVNEALEWRQIDERHVAVSLSYGAERHAVTFEFAEGDRPMQSVCRGDIIGSRTEALPEMYFSGPEGNRRLPGRAEFSNYKPFGSVRIPAYARWTAEDPPERGRRGSRRGWRAASAESYDGVFEECTVKEVRLLDEPYDRSMFIDGPPW